MTSAEKKTGSVCASCCLSQGSSHLTRGPFTRKMVQTKTPLSRSMLIGGRVGRCFALPSTTTKKGVNICYVLFCLLRLPLRVPVAPAKWSQIGIISPAAQMRSHHPVVTIHGHHIQRCYPPTSKGDPAYMGIAQSQSIDSGIRFPLSIPAAIDCLEVV